MMDKKYTEHLLTQLIIKHGQQRHKDALDCLTNNEGLYIKCPECGGWGTCHEFTCPRCKGRKFVKEEEETE
jgi:DnaJ-class molecular chaperone